MRTSVPWDPLVFYMCANIYKCVVSIQANDTDEYRIYPDTVSNKPIIKFARVELSNYVCLKLDQEAFGKFSNLTFLKQSLKSRSHKNKKKLCEKKQLRKVCTEVTVYTFDISTRVR